MEHNEIKESIKKDFFNMNGLIGTTGREQEVIRYCRNIVQDYADDTEVMDTGNLIATFYGDNVMAILRNGNQRLCFTHIIPRRYSHSPFEVTDLKVAEIVYKILMNMVERDIKLEFL